MVMPSLGDGDGISTCGSSSCDDDGGDGESNPPLVEATKDKFSSRQEGEMEMGVDCANCVGKKVDGLERELVCDWDCGCGCRDGGC
mmetsp:Transcript_5523/g.11718  ORF Transcript_5523/g.11718 Transcript_5523/m.11718 type:complete len:86 (+) Transcript_5523:627-884(+)